MFIFLFIMGVVVLIYWLFLSPYSQVFGHFPYRSKTSKKLIALTFDDGPNEPFTSRILDILDNKQVQATFFCVGKCIQRFPEVTKRADKAGHVIGNHSWSHQFSKYFLEPSFQGEIDKTQTIIQQIIGKTPNLFRPPWLWRQPLLLASVRNRQLNIISGIFGHELEVFQPSAQKMASRVARKVKPGSIIIFHDGFDARGGNRSETVKAVKLVIDGFLAKGYQFVTVDKLLDLKAYKD